MNELASLAKLLRAGSDLDRAQAETAAHALTHPDVAAEEKKAFLEALYDKGETPSEVTAFAEVFRALALDPDVDDWATRGMDIVGTGGDGLNTFNFSSATACLVAAAGVPVLKHGNRSATSKSGSADFLETLGFPLQMGEAERSASLEELAFTFFFAPAFHPAFKEIVPVRKALAAEGRKTVFNILGPLINPARPAFALLGVFDPRWQEPMAKALTELGLKRGWVVCCELPDGRFCDELTCAGTNHAVGAGEWLGRNETWSADDLGLAPAKIEELAGGEAAENVATFKQIATGEGPPAIVDTLLLNTGVALWIAGATDSTEAGIERARETLSSETLRTWIERIPSLFS